MPECKDCHHYKLQSLPFKTAAIEIFPSKRIKVTAAPRPQEDRHALVLAHLMHEVVSHQRILTNDSQSLRNTFMCRRNNNRIKAKG